MATIASSRVNADSRASLERGMYFGNIGCAKLAQCLSGRTMSATICWQQLSLTQWACQAPKETSVIILLLSAWGLSRFFGGAQAMSTLTSPSTCPNWLS